MGYEQNLHVMASCRGFMGFDPQVDFNDIEKILDAAERGKGVWTVNNHPWQRRGDIEHADDFSIAREAIDRSERRCGLYLCLAREKKQDALRLAGQVRDYCAKRGRLAE